MNDRANHHGHSVAERNLLTAFVLNLGFAVIEVIGGVLTGSMAILANAVHDLGDAVAIGFALAMERLSSRRADHRFSYGYRRFTLLGGLLTGLVLVAGSIGILVHAVPRLTSPGNPHAPGMLAMSVVGVIVNGAAALRFRGTSSLTERVVLLHLLEDVLGWIAVMLVSVVLLLAKLPVLDPLLSMIIAVWVLSNVFRSLSRIGGVFLQAVPSHMSLEQLEEEIRALPGVIDTHDLRLWSLDGESSVLTAHIIVGGDMAEEDVAAIKKHIREIASRESIAHTTIEIEPGNGHCSLSPG